MNTRTIALSVALFSISTAVQAGHELDERDVGDGEQLYAEHCASCHGAELQGQPDWRSANEDGTLPAPPHDETGHTWHHDNQLLFEYTWLGGSAALANRGAEGFKSGMPGFADAMTDDEIWDVLAYIRSVWPEQIQELQAMRNPPHD